MNKKIEAYEEILSVLNKHIDVVENDSDLNIFGYLNLRIELCGMIEQFGIDINDWSPLHYSYFMRLDGERFISKYGDERQIILWEDFGMQPENEWLYVVQFSSGAYFFGRDYPSSLFDEFFLELKQFGPKYIDTRNHTLYFSHDKARDVHENYHEILLHYRNKYDQLCKNKLEKISLLEAELKQLRG